MVKKEHLPELLAELRSANLAGMYDRSGSNILDLPELVEQYLLNPGSHRDKLWDRIQYQKSVYEPTPVVARILIKAIQLCEYPDEEYMLMMGRFSRLTTMTESQNLLDWVPEGNPGREGVLMQFEKEKAWLQGVREACWEIWPWLYDQLEEGTFANSVQGPYLAVWAFYMGSSDMERKKPWREAEKNLVASLQQNLMRAENPIVQSGYIMALHQIGEWFGVNNEPFHHAMGNYAFPAHYLAAIPLAEPIPDAKALAAFLKEGLAHRTAIDEALGDDFPWTEGSIRLEFTPAICELMDAEFWFILPDLIEIARTEADSHTFITDCMFPLERYLNSDPYEAETFYRDLISAMVENDKLWEIPFPANRQELMNFNLPPDREGLRKYLQDNY